MILVCHCISLTSEMIFSLLFRYSPTVGKWFFEMLLFFSPFFFWFYTNCYKPLISFGSFAFLWPVLIKPASIPHEQYGTLLKIVKCAWGNWCQLSRVFRISIDPTPGFRASQPGAPRTGEPCALTTERPYVAMQLGLDRWPMTSPKIGRDPIKLRRDAFLVNHILKNWSRSNYNYWRQNSSQSHYRYRQLVAIYPRWYNYDNIATNNNKKRGCTRVMMVKERFCYT